MIRIRLFKNRYAMERCTSIIGGSVARYDRKILENLLFERDINVSLQTIPPFHDEESIKLLNAFGFEVSEDHWYSIVGPDPYIQDENGERARIRMPFTQLGYQLNFTLTLIYYSREGYYLTYRPYVGIEEKTWKILAQMPFDILLATTGDVIGKSWELPEEYLIENYPHYDTEIEVYVKPHKFIVDLFHHDLTDDCPAALSKEDGGAWNTGFRKPRRTFYRDSDGVNYVGNDELELWALDYSWENDLEDVAEYLLTTSAREGARKLVSVNDTYSLADFQKMLCHAWGLSCPQEEDFCTFGRWCDKCQCSEVVEKEETFIVVSHLTLVPYCEYFRVVMMVVEKFKDGRYEVYDFSLYNVTLEEVLEAAIGLRKEDADIIVLFLVNGDIDDIMGLASTECGARVQWDRIEVYDREDAMQLFGKTLKEMLGESTEMDRSKYAIGSIRMRKESFGDFFEE